MIKLSATVSAATHEHEKETKPHQNSESSQQTNKQTKQHKLPAMSSKLDGGQGRVREVFFSAHHCPEVDLLPQHISEPQVPPLCSSVPAEKSSEINCAGKCEVDYLDICSTSRFEVEEEEEEEGEGSISDWSEEDLSLHFSPSIILQSDDEQSDPERSFECVDVTVETQVNCQEGAGLKMVPKRQIQLMKKKDVIDEVNSEKPQVMLKGGPSERGGIITDVPANELLRSAVHDCSDLFLRQYSMPASFHTCSTASSDVSSYAVSKDLVSGASQGLLLEGNSRCLQKSLSLDETKTKMASCIIKNILSKKMQVEQDSSETYHLKKKADVFPVLPQPDEQGEGRGGRKTGAGVLNTRVHVVRDMRKLVKNPYSLSFSTTTTTTADNNNKLTSYTVVDQEDNLPPTYQQAVWVKGHVAKVALNQSHNNKQSDTFCHLITGQQRDSKSIIRDDVTWPDTTPPVNTVNPSPQSVFIKLPPPPPWGTHPPPSAQKQASILGVSSLSAPGSSQQVFHPCFYTHTALPTFTPTLHPHLESVSYIHGPLCYIQTQLQPPPPAPILHLLRRSEENYNFPEEVDQTRTTGPHKGHSSAETPATQEQQQQMQQPLLTNIQGLLPAQVKNDYLAAITGSAAAPGVPFSVPVCCQLMFDPKTGQRFYVETPSQPQKKILLDPETGQVIQVLLPAACSASNAIMLPTRCTHPTPAVVQVGGGKPTILSVMQIQAPMAVPSLYSPTCLPLTVMTSHLQHPDDITSAAL